MKFSAELLQKVAGSTLGPFGRNCLIEYEAGVPRVTKDGVTVVKNLEVKNRVNNMVLETLKSISHNTNKICGDNTTTSTIIGTEIIK